MYWSCHSDTNNTIIIDLLWINPFNLSTVLPRSALTDETPPPPPTPTHIKLITLTNRYQKIRFLSLNWIIHRCIIYKLHGYNYTVFALYLMCYRISGITEYTDCQSMCWWTRSLCSCKCAWKQVERSELLGEAAQGHPGFMDGEIHSPATAGPGYLTVLTPPVLEESSTVRYPGQGIYNYVHVVISLWLNMCQRRGICCHLILLIQHLDLKIFDICDKDSYYLTTCYFIIR